MEKTVREKVLQILTEKRVQYNGKKGKENTKMSDKELFKAIKKFEEENNLKEVREVNIILRKIKGICRDYQICKKDGKRCPFLTDEDYCIFSDSPPEAWEIK